MVVRDIAFAPDGKILAAACSDGLVRRWQVPSGKRVPPLVHREGSAASVA
jgi:WD40 repeat protein